MAMKHVNEELPDVQALRPELSAASALVVERATAKDPAERYADIGEMIDDLSTALEVEAARAGSTTGEATSVLEAVPPAQRKLSARARWSWGLIGLAVLIAAAVVVVILIDSSGNTPIVGNQETGGGAKTTGAPVEIESATAYDPEGDNHEEDGIEELAIDGDPTGTSWSTEHYDSANMAGTKTGPDPGVGIYVTTTAVATPTKMVVRSPTPGWEAQIFAAPAGPPEEIEEWGEPIAEVSGVEKVEEIDLHLGKAAKYFLIWITKLSPAADQEGRYQVEISDIKLFE
ncbi:MAG: hypothetical protein JSS97_21240 [Actinobacteria bacterium]|nr:hypothetical protein [Actinomycetota bacterium]